MCALSTLQICQIGTGYEMTCIFLCLRTVSLHGSMANMKSLPSGALASRTSLVGTPLRAGCTNSRRQIEQLKTRAIAAPERNWDVLDKAEESRLQETDAFAELVHLSKKQSVNKPQKVRTVRACRPVRMLSRAPNRISCILSCFEHHVAGGAQLSAKPYIP